MASKIAKQLTPEQVVELLETLAKTPGGEVLRVIQAAARERGIEVSLMGATSFRDTALHPYLAKLRAARQKSDMLAEAVTAGDESGLLASARTMLADKINDLLMTDELDDKQVTLLSKALGTLSTSNQQDRMTAARLREYEAKEEARKAEAAKLEARKNTLIQKGGLSQEAIELMEATMKILS